MSKEYDEISGELIKAWETKASSRKKGITNDSTKFYEIVETSPALKVYDILNSKSDFTISYGSGSTYGHDVSIDGEYVLVGHDTYIQKTNLLTKQNKRYNIAENRSINISNDKSFFICCGGSKSNHVEKRDSNTMNVISRIGSHNGSYDINLSALSSDDKKLVTNGGTETYVWDLTTNTKLYTLKEKFHLDTLILSKDDKFLIGVRQQPKRGVCIWDFETGELIKIIETDLVAYMGAIDITLDNKLIIVGDYGGAISFLDAEKGSLIKTITPKVGEISFIKISDKDNSFYSGIYNLELRKLFEYKNKYLYKKDNIVYQPNNLGYNILEDSDIDEMTLSENGTTELKDIIGKDQELNIPTKLDNINNSEVYVTELPKGWYEPTEYEINEE